MNFDERWHKHVEMENYLMDEGQAQLVEMDKPFEEFFIDEIHKHVKHIRSIPLWPLHGTYWFVIRRVLWHDKSIKQQHEKGMIKLPNEIHQTIR